MTPPPSLQNLIETVQQDSPSDDLLDLLVTASATVHQLEDVNDALLGHFVDRCRRGGRSWSDISSALGVSKQAVHKRWSTPLADRLIEAPAPTFERFTARARSVLVAADAAARELHRRHVATEHLLLGLFAEPQGLAARALSAMSITRDSAHAAITAVAGADPVADRMADPAAGPAGSGQAQAGQSGAGRLPYSPEAAAALRDAVAEALELGHNYIGTEHILLGLLRDPDSRAARILDDLGANAAETRVRLTEMLRDLTHG
jgi:ATP-dependent Clp protease ATP-binding subunit ClpA